MPMNPFSLIALSSKVISAKWDQSSDGLKKHGVTAKSDVLRPGDVIGVERYNGVYEHYAVYIGKNKVIHYAGQGGDFTNNISIHEAPMTEFLKDSHVFFILEFPEKYEMSRKWQLFPLPSINPMEKIGEVIKAINYHLYSPEETVERAKSRLGETKYNLLFDNCEHFAIWCKTGISESHQVNAVLRGMKTITVYVINNI